MQKIIHNLRQQPEKVRKHILHVSMIVCGIVLASLWIYSLGTNLENSDTQAGVSQDLQTFSTVKNNMVNGYGDTSQQDSQQYLQTQENNL